MGLIQTGFVESVTHLPSMLTPQSPSIPILREAAVRVQAPILIIFSNSKRYLSGIQSLQEFTGQGICYH